MLAVGQDAFSTLLVSSVVADGSSMDIKSVGLPHAQPTDTVSILSS